VIAEYEKTNNQRIKDLAGEAHGHLGLIARMQDDSKTAIQEYEQAVKLLSGNSQRRKLYQARLDELK
jgi:hypothetical protein